MTHSNLVSRPTSWTD